MEIFTELFNIPLLQAIGVVVVIGLAERIGLPIISILKNILKMNGNGLKKEIDSDNRNAMQALLSQMEVLTTHFNHDTTSLLTEIRDGQVAMKDCIKKTNVKLDNMHEYGVKIRKE